MPVSFGGGGPWTTVLSRIKLNGNPREEGIWSSGQVFAHNCRVEELALPTRAIQLSGKVLSTW